MSSSVAHIRASSSYQAQPCLEGWQRELWHPTAVRHGPGKVFATRLAGSLQQKARIVVVAGLIQVGPPARV
eukprot:1151113-Pelagomonas_calceolata.AAC.3